MITSEIVDLILITDNIRSTNWTFDPGFVLFKRLSEQLGRVNERLD